MNHDSQYETQPSQKRRWKKRQEQEQTSKLQIKECEMQRRIADPYRARGRGGREGISACVGGRWWRRGVGGVSLWWRSVTWAHLGWGVLRQCDSSRHSHQTTRPRITAVLIHFGTCWQTTFFTDLLGHSACFWKSRLNCLFPDTEITFPSKCAQVSVLEPTLPPELCDWTIIL